MGLISKLWHRFEFCELKGDGLCGTEQANLLRLAGPW